MFEVSFVDLDRPACDLSDQLDMIVFPTHILSFTYDEFGRVETYVNSASEMYNESYVYLNDYTVEVQLNSTCSYTLHFNAERNLIERKDCAGETILKYFYKNNFLDSVQSYSNEIPRGYSQYKDYVNGNPTKITHAYQFSVHTQKYYGFTTTYTYDNGANPHSDKKFRVTPLHWEAQNNPISEIGIGGNHTSRIRTKTEY